MAVDPTGSAVSTPTSSATQAQRSGSGLDKDSFLKIMVAQLQNMDPMAASSQDPTQSVAQMAQFSMLEQLTNLSASADSTLSAQKQTQSLALLGKTVSYTDSSGTASSGVVQKVDFGSDGTTKLTLDSGSVITPSDVAGVQ
ncbi:MAG TPA: flagellar hook capping FlgD N-terminal domain-containing protein [Thermoleophilaceae bacterium]